MQNADEDHRDWKMKTTDN